MSLVSRRVPWFPLVLLVFTAACVTGPRHRVDVRMVADLPSEVIAAIDDARDKRDRAYEKEEQAEAALADARDRLRTVRAELDVARGEHEQALTRVEISRRGGEPGAIQSSEDRLAVADAKAEERRRKAILRQRKVELAALEREAARRRTAHLDALLHLRKALALNERDPDFSIERFVGQVEKHGARVTLAEEDLESVRIEAEEAWRTWREALTRLEALSGTPSNPEGTRRESSPTSALPRR